jgi:signal peptidase I
MSNKPDLESPVTGGTTITESEAPRRIEPPAITTTTRSPGPRQTSNQKPESQVKKGVAREYFESAVVTFVMALFGMTFIVQAVKVPTGSMKNTIYIGDHLLVNKFLFGPEDGIKVPVLPDRDIRRGDVIVFKYPGDPQVNYVKRVIGLPGDTVEYKGEVNRVYINGQELPEHRVWAAPQMPEDAGPLTITSDEAAPPAAWYTVYYQQEDGFSGGHYAVGQPYKVPVKGDPLPEKLKDDPALRKIYDGDGDGLYDSDQYFCMGDNRDNSEDSRFWGTVPRAVVVGRAMFVYWSIGPSDGSTNPLLDIFTKTRFSRTGRFIK